LFQISEAAQKAGSPLFADFLLSDTARALDPWRWPKGSQLWGREWHHSLHKIILEKMKDALGEKLRDERAGFCKEKSCCDH